MMGARDGGRCSTLRRLLQSSRCCKNVILKVSGVGKNTVIQVLSAIVAIGGYFKFERVLSL
jgi:hypothetical protein